MQNIIIGAGYKSILDKQLKALGLLPLYMPPNPYIDIRLSSHADLSLFYCGNSRVLASSYLQHTDFVAQLGNNGIDVSFSNVRQDDKYPHDTQLNACAVGSYLFCAKGISSEEILAEYPAEKRIFVNQGYCGCSICVVDSESIITADKGIAEAARARHLDVLLIEPGYFELAGYNYGFIGGSAFKISPDCMAFTGKIAHPEKENILSFMRDKGVFSEILTDLPAFDIGKGIIIA